MKVFEIMNRFPLLGAVVCALLLVFLNGPKTYNGMMSAGIIGGATNSEGHILQLSVEERTGRRGRVVEDCHLLVATESGDREVRVECEHITKFDKGQTIELVEVDNSLEVKDYPFSSYKFDLALALLELAGCFYFGRKFLRERAAKV